MHNANIKCLLLSSPPTSKRCEGIGTLSKKFKPPEITEQDKIVATVEVQKNTVKASIIDLWKRLCVCVWVLTVSLIQRYCHITMFSKPLNSSSIYLLYLFIC